MSDQTINLNPPALRPVAKDPWRDDALQRENIALELNALVDHLARGAESAAIALDGGYGTGKTFILERWVQELRNGRRVAMYYNAWENDCDDDPLVSLVETLVSNDQTTWGQQAAGALNEALNGVLLKYTGIDAQKALKAAKKPVDLLGEARTRRMGRQKLKKSLTDLVNGASNKRAVVVIDELDRCRPTFAHELMERVKHVLNVRGLVFGVNMVTLQETVKAIYGDVDTHQYLLRMFTTTLHMPPVAFPGDSDGRAENFLRSLAERYGLLGLRDRYEDLWRELDDALRLLGLLADAGGLTPRELERVMWLLGKVAGASVFPDKHVSSMFPHVLVPLTITRVKSPSVYFETVSRQDNALAVINYVFQLFPEACSDDFPDIEALDKLEMSMYSICHRHDSEPPAYSDLRRFVNRRGANLESVHLSQRLTNITKERARALLKVAPARRSSKESGSIGGMDEITFKTLQFITSRFDVVWPRDRAQ